jgi:thymidylate kinase
MNLKQSLSILKSSLETVNESFVLLKEPDEGCLDVDILLSNRNTKSFRFLSENIKLPILVSSPQRGFVYYISSQGYLSAIDLFDSYFINDRTINWLVKNSSKSRFYKSINVLLPNYQFAYFLYKSIMKPVIKIHRLEYILTLSKNYEKNELKKICLELCEFENKRYLFDKMKNLINYIYLKNFNKQSYFNYFKQEHNHFIKKSLINTIKNKLFKNYFFSNKTNPIIVFIGVDGSGKTTSIDYLKRSFKCLDLYQTKIQSNQISSNLIKLILNFLFYINKNIIKHKTNIVNSYLIPILYYLDFKNKFKYIKKESNKGKIVLIDRWWFDYFVSPKREFLSNKFNNIFNYYLRLESPFLFVFLQVDNNTLIERRPNENIKILNKKSNSLEKILNMYYPDKFIKINSKNNISINIKTITKKLYSMWYYQKN